MGENPQRFIDFLMRFELDLKKPDPKHAPISAFTIGASYVAGSLVATTGIALFVFGAVKGHFTGANKFKSAVQTLLVGGLAVGAAYALAHAFG